MLREILRYGRGITASSPLPEAMARRRRKLSRTFLRGSGIEVGALHNPLWTPRRAHVRYVDRLPVDALRQHYPELAGLELVEVDIIDDGERLTTIDEGSLDFVIGNHFLEHCENPLGTIRNHLAKLKPDGILFYAVPDKRLSFDVERPLTEFAHLVRDDRDGPGWSRPAHYEEWARLVQHSDDVSAETARLISEDYSIHFHVWDEESFADFLVEARAYLDGAFSTLHLERNENEIIAVLQRAEP